MKKVAVLLTHAQIIAIKQALELGIHYHDIGFAAWHEGIDREEKRERLAMAKKLERADKVFSAAVMEATE